MATLQSKKVLAGLALLLLVVAALLLSLRDDSAATTAALDPDAKTVTVYKSPT